MRVLGFALSVCCAFGCSEVGISSADLDELDRLDPGDPISVPVDASTPAVPDIDVDLSAAPDITPTVDARSHDCHEPCGEPCARNEVCCLSTHTCLPVDCPGCCPDPEFRDIVDRAGS